MDVVSIINDSVIKYLNENYDANIWYHGSPDVRDFEKEGGFSDKTITIPFMNNIEKYNQLQNQMEKQRISGDEEGYFETLNSVGELSKDITIKKPIFFTDKYPVAKTYADPKRSFDYQNAKEGVYKAKIEDGKNIKIFADGDRFRFINLDSVKRGFLNAGVPEETFNKTLDKFNFYLNDKTGIKTDMIAAIAQYLNFDTVDVNGVLDSYHGGNIKSTVKMVFNPKNIHIIG
jgi:hypothetical protein